MTVFISKNCLQLSPKSAFMPILTIHAHQKEWASIGHQYEMNKNKFYSRSVFDFFSSYSSQPYKEKVLWGEL